VPDNERVAGFVYIGTAKGEARRAEAPLLADIAQALAAVSHRPQ
jgi:hypothetical protein